MYISGDITTFESRLHQLAEKNQDINDFIDEAQTYLSIVDEACKQKWNREIGKRKYILLDSVNYLIHDAL